MKAFAQRLLKQCGVYYRLKTSVIYDLYWRIADPQTVRDATAERDFYRTVLQGLRPNALIFDVGANVGLKTRTFLRMGARVIAVDPDPANQHVLRQSFNRLRMRPRRVQVVPVACSDTSGTKTLWRHRPGFEMNTLSQKWVDILHADSQRFGQTHEFQDAISVTTRTIDDLILEYGRPFFVKIDVEGAEPQAVGGLTQPVPYLSFEVNLPEFLDEGLECVARLDRLTTDGRFNYVVSYRRGLELDNWLPATDFADTIRNCQSRSVEVFWATPQPTHLAGADAPAGSAFGSNRH